MSTTGLRVTALHRRTHTRGSGLVERRGEEAEDDKAEHAWDECAPDLRVDLEALVRGKKINRQATQTRVCQLHGVWGLALHDCNGRR